MSRWASCTHTTDINAEPEPTQHSSSSLIAYGCMHVGPPHHMACSKSVRGDSTKPWTSRMSHSGCTRHT